MRSRTQSPFLIISILGFALVSCSSLDLNSPPQLEPTAQPQTTSTPIVLPPTWTVTSTQPAGMIELRGTPIPTKTKAIGASSTPMSSTNVATEPSFSIEVITLVPDGDGYAGWQKFESKTASFWLPIIYWGLYDREGTEGWYRFFVKGFLDPYSKAIVIVDPARNPTPTPDTLAGEIDLSQIDFGIGLDDEHITSVVLISEPLEESSSLEQQFERIEREFGQGYRPMERQVIEGGRYETGRLIFKFREDPIQPSGMQILYVFLQPDRIWTLSFNTPIVQYDEMLTMSEKSANSFEINP